MFIDKTYLKVDKPKQDNTESITPEQKIIEYDNRMNEIDKEISSLKAERKSLTHKRSSLFESLNIPYVLKYEFVEKERMSLFRDCIFYIDLNGYKEILARVCVYRDESPLELDFIMGDIPDKYKNDFIMLWEKAHYEEVEEFNRRLNGRNKRHKTQAKVANNSDSIDFYRKCFRILAKNFHPDNGDGSLEDMQNLNMLKEMWGI